MVAIRPYRSGDSDAVRRLTDLLWVEDALVAGGRAWVAGDDGDLVACVALAPVPALPDLLELQGYVAAAQRRQGVGSRLLQRALTEARAMGAGRVVHEVESLASAEARFLQRHGFTLEHEEWEMTLQAPQQLPAPALPPSYRLRSYPRDRAIARFLQLYEASFAGTAWYQPYAGKDDVSQELAQSDDLLFVEDGETAVAFAWMRRQGPKVAEIEPIGVATTAQGQGIGRALLLAACHRLAQRGVREVRIGLWRANERARRLYESVGFRHVDSRYYLARALTDEA